MSFIKSLFQSTKSPAEAPVASNTNAAPVTKGTNNRPHLASRRFQRRIRRDQRAA